MGSILLLGSILAAGAPATACPAPPPVYVAVLMDVAAVATRTDFTLAQIEAMRQRAGGVDRHPTLGFYGHRFGYTVEVKPVRADDNNCVGSVQVSVHVVLSDRVIEIGRDLLDNPCLYGVAEAHYRRHASADDLMLRQYAQAIAPAVKAAQLVPPQPDFAIDKVDRHAIEQLVRSTIDATLVPYDAARKAAQASVDTRTEAVKMATTCTTLSPRDRHT